MAGQRRSGCREGARAHGLKTKGLFLTQVAVAPRHHQLAASCHGTVHVAAAGMREGAPAGRVGWWAQAPQAPAWSLSQPRSLPST